MRYIKSAVSRARTTISVFVVIMLTGFFSYLSIPVELNPDVTVPVIITTIVHQGISPEDAERLLSKPTEIELKTVEGITQISSISGEGVATVVVEFDVTLDSNVALQETRADRCAR
jgi:multidrug efflux pump